MLWTEKLVLPLRRFYVPRCIEMNGTFVFDKMSVVFSLFSFYNFTGGSSMKLRCLFAVCVMIAAHTMYAQQSAQFVADVKNAHGLEHVQSITLNGVMTQFDKTTIVSYLCRNDNHALITMRTPETGLDQMSYKGNDGWIISEMAGGSNKMPLRSMDLMTTREAATMMGLMTRLEKAASFTIGNRLTENGKTLIRVLAHIADNDDRVLYYDPETMYLVREVRKEMNQGSLDVVVEYSDYRRVNGVALPHRIEKKIGNDIIAVYVFDTAKINMPMADFIFDNGVKQ